MASSSESMTQVSIREQISAMTNATEDCDWNHTAEIDAQVGPDTPAPQMD